MDDEKFTAMDDSQIAYNEGADAYRDGLPMSENPFKPLSPDWHDWQRGWCDAQNDDADWPSSEGGE